MANLSIRSRYLGEVQVPLNMNSDSMTVLTLQIFAFLQPYPLKQMLFAVFGVVSCMANYRASYGYEGWTFAQDIENRI